MEVFRTRVSILEPYAETLDALWTGGAGMEPNSGGGCGYKDSRDPFVSSPYGPPAAALMRHRIRSVG